ncbi:MICAL-like protein 1 isoform X2 [Epinephelus fuscoguttatus]|uniref:MICAL-like protein 1 isoform X2 n=1 Tax=Epinephelus fuscoguttatus TaxID=293821 RepID=UPI0020D02FB1|nr:MICAL-like protein 1 isoform X2 [Epinephelus fuscoguttatus]
MASPKTVLEWCRVTCANYPNVEIKNMSTSFRDGLAFCAIIHKHRPDLIDFSSLSKDNVYQNNKLAFDTAARELGIPPLLDPKDMVSAKVPDCLSVITYLSQYYYYFNRKSYGVLAGLASLKSSHVAFLNNLTKTKSPDSLKPLKSLTHLETSREDRLSNARPRTVCSLCFRPVHLIQRHLIDGKVYHRSCFRCKVCCSTLLPGSYTQGSDAGSLICTHHLTDSESTRVDLSQPVRSAESRPKRDYQSGYFSLGGSAISSVPHYTKKTESQDRLVCKTIETEGKERQERIKEVKEEGNRDSPVGPKKPARPRLPGKAGSAPIPTDSESQQEGAKTQETSELSSQCERATEGRSRPVPAPRRLLDSSVAPVPTPRNKTAQPMYSSRSAGWPPSQDGCSPVSSRVTSPTRDSPRVQTNHPWLSIVHPGPWTQLPPIESPLLIPRYKSIPKQRSSCPRPRVRPPNPFAEVVNEEALEKITEPEPEPEPAAVSEGIGDTVAVVCAGYAAIECTPEETVGASSEPAKETCVVSDLDKTENKAGSLPDVTDTAAAAAAGLHANLDTEEAARLCATSGTEAAAGLCATLGTEEAAGLHATLDTEEAARLCATSGTEEAAAILCATVYTEEAAGLCAISDREEAAAGPCATSGTEEAAAILCATVDTEAAAAAAAAAGLCAISNTEEAAAGLCAISDREEAAAGPCATLGTEEAAAILCATVDTEAAAAAAAAAGLCAISNTEEAAAGLCAISHTEREPQSHILPRSVSVPAITSAPLTEANEYGQFTSSLSKLACRENPFDRKPAMLKSKSCQVLPSTRGPAPGHGFPLIKRKVQTDQNVSTEDLQVEIRELDKHLEALEQRGVELEGNLRDTKNGKEEEQMLMEWFSLIHEKHVMMRKETELVYLKKQQQLEERQADVEYELRCLLNKPETDWSQEDRVREQQLMNELVAIIEQRNEIVSSLDQDRQREREEDDLMEAMMKNKEFQKEGLKELKKSKGKFKATKMFKLLNQRAESTKDSVDQKS